MKKPDHPVWVGDRVSLIKDRDDKFEVSVVLHLQVLEVFGPENDPTTPLEMGAFAEVEAIELLHHDKTIWLSPDEIGSLMLIERDGETDV